MSAVVGILNKQAIAIAADSAVSVNGKIFNRALKIFTLSRYEPVGIMIYSAGSFIGTPWETIIKIYRDQLKETHFNKVDEYAQNFIDFIIKSNFFCEESSQKEYLINTLVHNLFTITYNELKLLVKPDKSIEELFSEKLDAYIKSWDDNPEILPHFTDYTFEHFTKFIGKEFDDYYTSFIENESIVLSDHVKYKLKQLAYRLIVNKESFLTYTGLVFVGFGQQEIFPSLVSVNVQLAIDSKLKYHKTHEVNITHSMGSSIQPFAQTEAMSTILQGIAPTLENIYVENFKQFIEKYNHKLINITKVDSPVLAESIRNIDIGALVSEYQAKLLEAKQINYINPLMDAVSNLSKEDLAEMAESLIYLTYLQKRITFAAEDVGGDVDVAVISKGDGFIWIKRKHYFKPELNRFFFDNYFK